MNKLSLSSILLFPLVIFFVMQYRINAGDTSYALFGLIFLSLLAYLAVDLFTVKERLLSLIKNSLLWFIILVVLGSSFSAGVIVRHQTVPEYNVHDIIIQQEAAIRFLLHGKNPYQETYFGTPLEKWHYSDTEINPALYHFVMMPFYLYFAIPFYFVSNHTIGYFDARIPLYLLFLITLITAFIAIKNGEKRRLFVILLAFNPAMLPYVLEGRSDMFMFTFLFIGLCLLRYKKYYVSAILLACAFAVKQSVWPLFPFYFAYIYFNSKNLLKTIKIIISFIITFTIFTLPFYIWNSQAFTDSTISYLSGAGSHSYPISGYGLGMILNQAGIIKNVHTYYPFTLWQIIFGLPLAIFFIKFLKQVPSISRLILVYGLFLFVFWYLSRYFNNSHVGYLSMVFIVSYFLPEKEV